MTGTQHENSRGSWPRLPMVVILILAAAVVAVFAGARGGFLGKARGAYDRWSLRSRVDALWESRLQGDMAKSERFVVNDGKPKAALGRAIRYLTYEVQEMKIEGEKATVSLSIRYRLDFPGFSRESDPAETAVMKQSWVRTGGDWYWDPGPVPGSFLPVRVEPDGAAAGTGTPVPVPPKPVAPAPASPPDAAPRR